MVEVQRSREGNGGTGKFNDGPRFGENASCPEYPHQPGTFDAARSESLNLPSWPGGVDAAELGAEPAATDFHLFLAEGGNGLSI